MVVYVGMFARAPLILTFSFSRCLQSKLILKKLLKIRYLIKQINIGQIIMLVKKWRKKMKKKKKKKKRKKKKKKGKRSTLFL
jgi:radical SAM superfamily enzyme with C-terminal helix-hairpin-helix motif